MQQSIVKQATQHFQNGDYKRAKATYQQAGQRYGSALFANSIRLCELRMRTPGAGVGMSTNVTAKHTAAPSQLNAGQQLEKTQKLLEHYYTRCQELEYQLLDRD
jgi:hypothetical protein